MQMRNTELAPIKAGLTLLSAALVTACASTSDVPSVANLLGNATEQDGRACVRTRDIQGYGILENDVLSVNARHGYYLMTLLPGCVDIRGSMAVAFGGDFYEVCGQSMDRITTESGQCSIGQVYEFENREAAFAIYETVKEKREAMKEKQDD